MIAAQQTVGYAPQQVLGIAAMPFGTGNITGVVSTTIGYVPGAYVPAQVVPSAPALTSTGNFVNTNVPLPVNMCSIGMIPHGQESISEFGDQVSTTAANEHELRFVFI